MKTYPEKHAVTASGTTVLRLFLRTALLAAMMFVLAGCGQKTGADGAGNASGAGASTEAGDMQAEETQIPGAEAGNSLEEQLKLAWNFLTEGNYKEAVLAFTAVIDIDPKNGEAYKGRADSYKGWALETDDQALYAEYLAKAAEDYTLAEQYLTGEETAMLAGSRVLASEDDSLQHLKELYLAGEYDALVEAASASERVAELEAKYPGFIYYEGETGGSGVPEGSGSGIPDGLGVAVYGKGLKEKTFLYIGDWQGGQRSGHGIALYHEKAYNAYCIADWADDMLNGEAETRTPKHVLTGTAVNGLPNGRFRKLSIEPDGRIYGYEYDLKDGIPQPFGVMAEFGNLRGHTTEDILAYRIESSGEIAPCWHPWAGLRCAECHDESEGIDMVMNSYDHAWAGWGEEVKKYSFYAD